MKKLLHYSIYTIAICCSLLSCSKEDNYSCEVAAPSISDVSQSNLSSYITKNYPNATLHPAGFYYEIAAEGTGKQPSTCFNIIANYEGKLSDGTVFDKSNKATFNALDLIYGWRIGIPLVKEKGIITLILPPEMAYGEKGIKDVIPGNAITIFKIEIIEVIK